MSWVGVIPGRYKAGGGYLCLSIHFEIFQDFLERREFSIYNAQVISLRYHNMNQTAVRSRLMLFCMGDENPSKLT